MKLQKPATKDVLKFILIPLLFLTVAMLGGMRFAAESEELRFLKPQLIALILGAFVMILFVRGGVIETSQHIGERLGLTDNLSGIIFLASLYFATAQIFNLVTPERGLFNFCFNLFYFLIFLNNLFLVFNPVRLAKSLSIVLGISFLLKYLVLADLFAPSESWAKYIFQKLIQTATLGALEFDAFAPATGYLAFLALALYLLGIWLIAPRANRDEEILYKILLERHLFKPIERRRLLAALAEATQQEEEIVEAEIIEEKSVE